MMSLGTAVCFVIAIGARSVVMEPSVPKLLAFAAMVIAMWLALASRRER
jgi:hypothetical protein